MIRALVAAARSLNIAAVEIDPRVMKSPHGSIGFPVQFFQLGDQRHSWVRRGRLILEGLFR